jgi:hypothetical protein
MGATFTIAPLVPGDNLVPMTGIDATLRHHAVLPTVK